MGRHLILVPLTRTELSVANALDEKRRVYQPSGEMIHAGKDLLLFEEVADREQGNTAMLYSYPVVRIYLGFSVNT